jgi:hypothetical protein
MAGVTPTKLQRVRATAGRIDHVKQMIKSGRSGTMMPVTTDKEMKQLLYTVMRPLKQ